MKGDTILSSFILKDTCAELYPTSDANLVGKKTISGLHGVRFVRTPIGTLPPSVTQSARLYCHAERENESKPPVFFYFGCLSLGFQDRLRLQRAYARRVLKAQ